MPQTEEAKGLVYRHIEDDVERIIPTQAKAQAHEKVEIHPRWRQTPDLREWPSHWPVAEARTPGVVQLAGVVDLSFVAAETVERKVSRDEFNALKSEGVAIH